MPKKPKPKQKPPVQPKPKPPVKPKQEKPVLSNIDMATEIVFARYDAELLPSPNLSVLLALKQIKLLEEIKGLLCTKAGQP